MTLRRDFLRGVAGCCAGAAIKAAALPLVPFGKHQISRLIAGTNPFYGYSHFNRVLDTHMREWNTQERVCETLRLCEQNGINTIQTAATGRNLSDIEHHRAEGGNLQVIALSTLAEPPEEAVRKIKPVGLAHFGELTDVLLRDGKMEQVQEFLKRVRQTGVMAGISTHKPEVVEFVEDKGWDVDFYMTCVYNRTRTPEEIRRLLGELPLPPTELYLESDPARMYRVVRQTRRTCLVFKILAAGRLTGKPELLDRAFGLAFDSIKPKDCVIVGMYQRFQDQVTDNADRVRRILRSGA